jgi:hypothetical protein
MKKSTQMLVFRSGAWRSVQVVLSDPLLTEDHKRYAASIIASRLEKGDSLHSATVEAEKSVYLRIYRDLRVSREEHRAP